MKRKASRWPTVLLAACAALLGLVPIAGSLLPQALQSGLSRSSWDVSWPGVFAGIALAAVVWLAVSRGRLALAASMVAGAAVIGPNTAGLVTPGGQP